jgi:hypothetical protein
MRSLIVSAFVVSLAVSTPAWSQTLTFRGLSYNSKQADVLKIFPLARPQNYCRAGETVSRNASGLSLCEQLSVDGYVLDNVSFDLTFVFNPDGTLRYVSLIKMFGKYGKDEGNTVPVGTINTTFTSLADLLSSKYGPAVADPPGSFLRRGAPDSELEWQPGRGTKWQDGGDRISLRSDGTESKTTPGLFRGTVQIFYTLARCDEFNKF